MARGGREEVNGRHCSRAGPMSLAAGDKQSGNHPPSLTDACARFRVCGFSGRRKDIACSQL